MKNSQANRYELLAYQVEEADRKLQSGEIKIQEAREMYLGIIKELRQIQADDQKTSESELWTNILGRLLK